MALAMSVRTSYPRPLRAKERDLLETVLPQDRPGYRGYRDHIARMAVIGEGRRGKGNIILGTEGDIPDIVSPLAPVVAYGILETTRDTFSITVREYVGRQIDVEVVSGSQEEVPDHFEEKRRWTYSTWEPGKPSPATGGAVREVVIDEQNVLAFSPMERRLWVYERVSGMVVLIPITNYYNELVLLKGLRDPKVALKSGLLFDRLDENTDEELRLAFYAYNKLRPKVQLQPRVQRHRERGLKKALLSLFGRKD